MFKVAIFDLNGTVIEDELLWRQSFEKVFAQEALKGELDTQPGVGLYDNWLHISDANAELKRPDIERLVQKTLEFYRNNIDASVEFRNGFLTFRRALESNNIACVLATSSSRMTLAKISDHFPALLEFFSVIVTGDEVEKRKPAPDIFLKALEELNETNGSRFNASDCVVFEDSNAGVMAAKSAEMYVVQLANGLEETIDTADMTAEDFTDSKLIELFGGGNL